MFPSIITTFNTVQATDRLNSPSHSALHNSISSVLTQVQTVIGVEGDSSVLGSLEYLIKSPDSNGGGHVQTANKGGTGQTSFTKGDLLVSTSNSVLSKLAIGGNGLVLTADSTQAGGMGWTSAGTTKVQVSASVVSIRGVQEGSVFSVSIPGSTLGTNNALRATAYISAHGNSGASVLVRALYGGGVVSSMMVRLTAINSMVGRIEYTLMANQSSVLQRAMMSMNLYPTNTSIISNQNYYYNSNVSSVNTTTTQTMGIVIHHSEDVGANLTDIEGVTVEKII